MESFATIANGFWPLTIIAKFSFLDVCGDLGCLSCASCLTHLVLITISLKFQLGGHQELYKKSECQTCKQSHWNREDPILNERFSPTKSLSLIYAGLKYLQFTLDQNPCSNKMFSFHQDKKVVSSTKVS